MLPREIALLVSSAMNKVHKVREPVTYRNVQFKTAGNNRTVDLSLEPYISSEESKDLILLLIEESAEKCAPPGAGETLNLDHTASQRIKELELELQLNKENLQATIEELETSNEELQATNEELLASNEELQSTNEELQSVNEELYTVNAEYQGKINELAELNNDMVNLLTSTNIGKIFLEPNLRIRKFTPPVTREIELLPHDEGRPVQDFAHPILRIIARDAVKVLDTEQQVENLFRNDRGTWYLLRLVPYVVDETAVRGAL